MNNKCRTVVFLMTLSVVASMASTACTKKEKSILAEVAPTPVSAPVPTSNTSNDANANKVADASSIFLGRAQPTPDMRSDSKSDTREDTVPATVSEAAPSNCALAVTFLKESCSVPKSKIFYNGDCDVYASCEATCVQAADPHIWGYLKASDTSAGLSSEALTAARTSYNTCRQACYTNGPATCEQANTYGRDDCGLGGDLLIPPKESACTSGFNKCAANCMKAVPCSGFDTMGIYAFFFWDCMSVCDNPAAAWEKTPVLWTEWGGAVGVLLAGGGNAGSGDSSSSSSSAHEDYCWLYPHTKECGGSTCDLNPKSPECTHWGCYYYPKSPECTTVYIPFCQRYPEDCRK